MVNVSKITQNYISSQPEIKACLAKKLVNFSSLARRIIKNEKLSEKYFNAILVAANRFSERLASSGYEKKIKALLKKSKVNVKTKMCRFVFAPHAHVEDEIDALHIIKGVKTTTIIADDEHYESIARRYEHWLLDKRRGLVEVAVISPAAADKVVGLTAYLAGLLAGRGINVLTTLGSYTDDIFIIEEKDLAGALEVFGF